MRSSLSYLTHRSTTYIHLAPDVDPTDSQVYFAFCILKAVVEIAFAIYTLWLWNIIFAVVQAWFLGTKQAGWVPILLVKSPVTVCETPQIYDIYPQICLLSTYFLLKNTPHGLAGCFFHAKLYEVIQILRTQVSFCQQKSTGLLCLQE